MSSPLFGPYVWPLPQQRGHSVCSISCVPALPGCVSKHRSHTLQLLPKTQAPRQTGCLKFGSGAYVVISNAPLLRWRWKIPMPLIDVLTAYPEMSMLCCRTR